MSGYFTTVTRKGQITIPVDIRRQLKIAEGDLIAVEREGDSVRLRRSQSIVDRTAGALSKYVTGPPLSAEEERAATEMAIARDVVERMNRS
jgi:AbrB family looped-hinge helix DNA binding protein